MGLLVVWAWEVGNTPASVLAPEVGNTTVLVMASCMGTFDSPIPHWLLESKGYFSAAEEGELQSPLHFSLQHEEWLWHSWLGG